MDEEVFQRNEDLERELKKLQKKLLMKERQCKHYKNRNLDLCDDIVNLTKEIDALELKAIEKEKKINKRHEILLCRSKEKYDDLEIKYNQKEESYCNLMNILKKNLEQLSGQEDYIKDLERKIAVLKVELHSTTVAVKDIEKEREELTYCRQEVYSMKMKYEQLLYEENVLSLVLGKRGGDGVVSSGPPSLNEISLLNEILVGTPIRDGDSFSINSLLYRHFIIQEAVTSWTKMIEDGWDGISFRRCKERKVLSPKQLKGHKDETSESDDQVVAVVIKDGIETEKHLRVIETTSIATQTDRVALLATAVQTTYSDSDSEDESSETRHDLGLSRPVETTSPTEDIDFDLFRSCRKLSVLPEEELEDYALHRNSSIKSNLQPRFGANLSQSADDVTRDRANQNDPSQHVASCADLPSWITNPVTVSVSSCEDLDDPDDLVPESLHSSSDIQVSLLDPEDALRQPHSFDSYLDPQQVLTAQLPRQISDPTQKTVCAPFVTRRGSFIKRPKSTCRPLTLPCKFDERVPKVRFDLTENNSNNSHSPKEGVLVSKLKQGRVVSRFLVQPVDESELLNDVSTRKRPPLIHSVVYKKSVLYDLSPPEEERQPQVHVSPMLDSPTTPPESVFEACFNGGYLLDDIYPCKRRKQSDVSCYSVESSEGVDILTKSIRLHENSECIVMRDLSGDSDTDIPYIDAEELAVIRNEISRTTQTDVSCFDTQTYVSSPMNSVETDFSSPTTSNDVFPVSPSDSSSGTYCTAADELTPLTDEPQKGIGLSKSPTVLKNLASFESYDSPDVKHRLLPKNIVEEDEEEVSEISEASDTVTYVTGRSDGITCSSEGDSDTYVTVRSDFNKISSESDTYVTLRSDRSLLERKPSDLSENSNSPYNTPPDTSSASFCTPPDHFSPLLRKINKQFKSNSGSSTSSSVNGSPATRRFRNGDLSRQNSTSSSFNYDTPSNNSPFASPSRPSQSSLSDTETITIYNVDDANFPREREGSDTSFTTNPIIFDCPKLEFYETNDSVENLEAFLEAEEGLREESPKRNSLDSGTDSRFCERRLRRPLSRQNSTEEYAFLEPQDSSLNLSEEVSSPSTTPDTSNKTVIFKNKPLTVSNTIDLDDDDFPISESEIVINLNGSQTEIVEIPLMHTCRSEPCIPSMGKTTLAQLSRQSCSMSEEPECGRYLEEPECPAIVISSVSSEDSVESETGRERDNSSPDLQEARYVDSDSRKYDAAESAILQPRPRSPCPLP